MRASITRFHFGFGFEKFIYKCNFIKILFISSFMFSFNTGTDFLSSCRVFVQSFCDILSLFCNIIVVVLRLKHNMLLTCLKVIDYVVVSGDRTPREVNIIPWRSVSSYFVCYHLNK